MDVLLGKPISDTSYCSDFVTYLEGILSMLREVNAEPGRVNLEPELQQLDFARRSKTRIPKFD